MAVSGASTLTTTTIDNLTLQDSNITSSSNADINITPGGTGSVVAAGISIKGTTISAPDSSSININEGLIVDGTASVSGALSGTSATLSSTLAVTGVATFSGTAVVDNITINDSTISTSSNADLNLTPGGTGNVVAGAITIDGTTLSAADSTVININEGLVVDGSATVQGTTTTVDIVSSGNVTVSGALTTGTFNVGDLNIDADGTISSDTNGDIVIDPAGTGAIVLTGNITHTGTQTTTGQMNVDNL